MKKPKEEYFNTKITEILLKVASNTLTLTLNRRICQDNIEVA
jgi:hypothetical protein